MSTPLKDDVATIDSTPGSSNSLLTTIRTAWRGDTGLVPILIGLAVLVVYFQIRSSVFLSAGNLTNLSIQATVYMLLGMAEIWLMLLGEIDLSVGVTCALSGMIATILTDTQYHWSWFIALPLAVVASTIVGLFNGFVVIKLRLPSFIVTLSAYLWVQGIIIFVINKQGTGGSVSITEEVLDGLVGNNFSPIATWIFILLSVGILAFLMVYSSARRRQNGLVTSSIKVVIAKIVGLIIFGVVLAFVFNTNRSNFSQIEGMPYAIPIDMFLLAACTFILAKTKAGRYVFAIGGNAEAARRAGITVDRYRLMAFGIAGFLTGVAGLLYASNDGGTNTSLDPTLTLYAVASAVIGGTSLFGGRGKMIHAVIGGLIIATIYNGMALISIPAPMQYVAVGAVLLVAVTIDSLARRGSTVSR